MILSGNKGEWSEIYVFLRLLDTGKLDVADENLNAIPNEFYRILEIIRKETETTNNYVREDDKVTINVVNDQTGENEQFSYPITVFAEKANNLLSLIKSTSGRAFQLPPIAAFLKELRIGTIKDVGHNRDITITIEDFRTGMPQTLGFSIKSFLGSDSTLFNAGTGTNFIYEVVLPEGESFDCDEFNRSTYPLTGRIGARLKKLRDEYNATFVFKKVQSDCLYQNLLAIDGHMPLLLAELLLIKSELGFNDIRRCTEELTRRNPLGIDTS
ncbi:MAG: HpaII family restriction endonuclease, partial [Prevotella sp.]|nr:HpaII family restriction endonuclease [Prevotella sp.]